MTALTRQERRERRATIGCGLKPRRRIRQQLRRWCVCHTPRLDYRAFMGIRR